MKTRVCILIALGLILLGGWASAADVHDFTGLPMTEDGWTDLLAMYQDSSTYTDSRIIYVSTSGNDSTAQDYSPGDSAVGSDPFNPSGTIIPYRTLDAAYRRLRDGYPDLLLLKRGDQWNESFLNWTKSGRSNSERMILGAYGPVSESRPVIEFFRAEGTSFSHNILVSIEMLGSTEDGTALERRSGGQNFLIEDCAVLKNPNTGMTFGSGVTNIAIRRCVIAQRYPTVNTGHTQGIYASNVTGFLLEENILDHNGWTDGTEGTGATIHNHNVYFDMSVRDVTIRYNLSSRASSHGFMPGGGAYLYANLSFRDPIGVTTSRSEPGQDGEISHTISNVFLHPWDSKESLGTNWGITIGNLSEGLIQDNILADYSSGTGGRLGIRIIPQEKGGTYHWVRNTVIEDNIIHNFHSTAIYVDGDRIENLQLSNNRIHDEIGSGYGMSQAIYMNRMPLSEFTSFDNRFYSTQNDGDYLRIDDTWLTLEQWKSRVADRTSTFEQTNPTEDYHVTNYLSSIGERDDLNSFFSRLQAQRKGNWDSRYTAIPIINFVRNAFGRASVDYDYSLRYVEEPDSSPSAEKPRGLRIE